MMAGWLKPTGYRPSRAGIVSNVNCAGVLLPRLEKRLARLVTFRARARPWWARAAAGLWQRCSRGGGQPGVRVVALGSPQVDPLAVHPLVRLQVEAVAAWARSERRPLRSGRASTATAARRSGRTWRVRSTRIPLVSVYSRSDGVVDSHSCLDPHATDLVEIRASHCGMAVSRAAWRAVAGALESFADADARRRPQRRAQVHRLPRAA